MRTLIGIVSATIVMHTDNVIVGCFFGSIVIYSLFKEFRNVN